MSVKGSDIIASQEKASAEYIEALREAQRRTSEALAPLAEAYARDCDRLVFVTKSVSKEEFAAMYPDINKGEG